MNDAMNTETHLATVIEEVPRPNRHERRAMVAIARKRARGKRPADYGSRRGSGLKVTG